jgi:hypothetical protein
MTQTANNDPAIRDHQAWLGYLQPDGLVVSPAALVDAQVFLERNTLPLQERFLEYVQEVGPGGEDGDEVASIQQVVDFVRGFLEWPDDCLVGLTPERPIPDTLKVAVQEGETLAPTFAFLDPRAVAPASPWLLLVRVLATGTKLDVRAAVDERSWVASPSQRFERLLRDTGVPIGLLVNGMHLRLVYAPKGENAGSLTFPVAAMAEVGGRPILAALQMLLHAYRLLGAPSAVRLPGLLRKSRDYQGRVSTDLAGQVLDALYELLRGFQAANERTRGELLRQVLAEHPDDVYGGLLNVLMRMVFLLYAEDRGLMPGSDLYVRHYSVHGLFERLRTDNEHYPDTMDHRYGAWAQLLALFRAVHGGSRHPLFAMPARSGYLFDPDRFPFLEGGRGEAEAGAPPPSPRREGPAALPGPIPSSSVANAPALRAATFATEGGRPADSAPAPGAEAVRRAAGQGAADGTPAPPALAGSTNVVGLGFTPPRVPASATPCGADVAAVAATPTGSGTSGAARFSGESGGARSPGGGLGGRAPAVPASPSTLDTRPALPLVSDGVVFRVLRNLLLLGGERLSYRTLDVEEIGSVYQTVMGFRLEVATGTSVALTGKRKHKSEVPAPVVVDLDALLAVPGDKRAKWLTECTDHDLTSDAEKAIRSAADIDGLLAALDRRIARNASPHPVAKGGLLLQPTDERRRSGSHYTPRSFTEPIVRTTLRPILDRLRREAMPPAAGGTRPSRPPGERFAAAASASASTPADGAPPQTVAVSCDRPVAGKMGAGGGNADEIRSVGSVPAASSPASSFPRSSERGNGNPACGMDTAGTAGPVREPQEEGVRGHAVSPAAGGSAPSCLDRSAFPAAAPPQETAAVSGGAGAVGVLAQAGPAAANPGMGWVREGAAVLPGGGFGGRASVLPFPAHAGADSVAADLRHGGGVGGVPGGDVSAAWGGVGAGLAGAWRAAAVAAG